jgi:arylsulfatase A-like enzyme
MTERFIAEILPRKPALAVLWCGEPDHIQHNTPLGSLEHLAVLREADRNAGLVIDAVARLREQGDDVLLIVGSDHGHETVSGVIDVEAELVAAGLKDGPESSDVVAMANGTSTLIYLHPDHDRRRDALEAFQRAQAWAGTVVAARDLASVGQADHHGLAFAVSMAADELPNEFGVPGRSLAAKPRWDKADRLECGQHGGLSRFEQSPVLLIDGAGFRPGAVTTQPAHIVDLAPTILRHLGVLQSEMDGSPLQGAPVHPSPGRLADDP